MVRSTVLPGGTVGVLGDGPAGRRIALAARTLGYRVQLLRADGARLVEPSAPRMSPDAGALPDHAPVRDGVALGCDVVTTSIEQVSARTLDAVARAGAVMRPAGPLVEITQDRVAERLWLARHGLQMVPWRAVDTFEQALATLPLLGGRAVLKPARRADGTTGVRRVRSAAELHAAWCDIGGERCALEQEADIDAELSVVVARAPGGTTAAYPAAESGRRERDGVPQLDWSVIPAMVPAQHAERARRLALTIAERLGIEGLLTVELFLLHDGRLVVNELVPGPHPTFVAAERATPTGQYEQLVRAVCGLPLGATTVTRPVAVAPLYADEWRAADRPRGERALRPTRVTLHLFGDAAPPPARHAGYLAADGDTSADAVARVVAARAALVASPSAAIM